MTNNQHTDDLKITKSTFRKLNIMKLIEEVNDKDINYYHGVFARQADAFKEEGKLKEGKALWLLSQACSPILNPESANIAFKPFYSGDGRRSFLPEDFTQNDIVFFNSILPEIRDFRLKARITDICWFCGQPRNPQLALTAIDSYIKYRFENEEHSFNCKAAYERAIFLCGIHKELTKERISNIHKYLVETIQKNIGNTGTVTVVSDLLFKIGFSDSAEDVINALIETAKNARFDSQRKLLENAYEMINRKKKPDKRLLEIHVKVAESYAEQASCATSSMFAADFYHQAILEYQKIPKRLRKNYVSEERLLKLKDLREEANQQATTEMAPISSPPINISNIVNACRDHVSGKKMPDVLFAFAWISEPQNKEKYREEATKIMRDNILTALFQTTHYARDGRITAKSPGVNLGDASDPANEIAIWQQMMSNYNLHVSLSVNGAILPALEVINAEHRITLPMLVGMCRASSAIPNGRILVWAKGLFFGFENDFMSAVHLLTPQVEHYVRINLKRNGIKTTTTDAIGVETENSMGTLLDNNEINQVLDEDTIFELKSIFTDSFGFNLRNEIAHGLVDSNLGQTYSAVYAWWFCLRLVVVHIPILPSKKLPKAVKKKSDN